MSIRKLLDDIMQNMAKDGKVFSNEQDFQFELALALKAEATVVKDVKLEALSLCRKWDGKEVKRDDKEYTDLIVETQDGKYYAIELKDKHPNGQRMYYSDSLGKILLMSHGAEYHNSFYFWEDVRRLENINQRFLINENKIEKGYAVFLSNNSKYWNPGEIKDKTWRLFSLKDGRKVKEGDLGRKGAFEASKKVFKNRFPDIEHEYTLIWKDYPVSVSRLISPNEKVAISENEFRYLLLEVNPV